MWTNIKKFEDRAQHVTKFVFEKDDIAVEAVLYRYPTYSERTVICFSTMCGCPMGCRFCGTGDYFVRSLSADEMVAQIEYILTNEVGGIDPASITKLQLLGMSMGEPCLVPAMADAFRKLSTMYPNAALLISSSGPRVDYGWVIDLAVDIPKVGLQFSVHESTDEARDALIPFKKKLSLDEIAVVGERFHAMTGRKPYFNYCAHEKNTSPDDATRLHSLFNPAIWEATVSVICERENTDNSGNQHYRDLAVDFGNALVEAGYNVRVFDPAGQDTIGGGCGQLPHYQEWIAQHPELAKPSVGHGLIKIHSPK